VFIFNFLVFTAIVSCFYIYISLFLARVCFIDTLIRLRQKHKQQSSTIYKKYEKTRPTQCRNVQEVPKQTFVNMPLGLIKCNINFFKKLLAVFLITRRWAGSGL